MPDPLITNVSPLGDLHVPALDRDVAAGEQVPVADKELAAALLAQAGVWAPANAAAQALIPPPQADPAEGTTDVPAEG